MSKKQRNNEKKLKRAVIYEEFQELITALKMQSKMSGVILSQIFYWSDIVAKSDEEVRNSLTQFQDAEDEVIRKRLEKKLRDGWFFKSSPQLSDEIMVVSKSTVDRTLKEFEDYNIILVDRKGNQRNNTNWIKLNIPLVRCLLHKLGYTLMEYPIMQPEELMLVSVPEQVENLIHSYLAEKEKLKAQKDKKSKNSKKDDNPQNPQPSHSGKVKNEGDYPQLSHGGKVKNELSHGGKPDFPMVGNQNNGLSHGGKPITETTSFSFTTFPENTGDSLITSSLALNREKPIIEILDEDLSTDDDINESYKLLNQESIQNKLESFEPLQLDPLDTYQQVTNNVEGEMLEKERQTAVLKQWTFEDSLDRLFNAIESFQLFEITDKTKNYITKTLVKHDMTFLSQEDIRTAIKHYLTLQRYVEHKNGDTIIHKDHFFMEKWMELIKIQNRDDKKRTEQAQQREGDQRVSTGKVLIYNWLEQ